MDFEISISYILSYHPSRNGLISSWETTICTLHRFDKSITTVYIEFSHSAADARLHKFIVCAGMYIGKFACVKLVFIVCLLCFCRSLDCCVYPLPEGVMQRDILLSIGWDDVLGDYPFQTATRSDI
ncbi:hypothetical protein CK203_083811 [Vitis vinifera]|uniref:Uncharacterized protein n=1 Tax=Vitis vinifera TaxID=29760 RepID=A0A438DLS4_VITVI|nr:hypothetical protein CK203_083811 [Vitis vinifera]